jgi:hypothetical protein
MKLDVSVAFVVAILAGYAALDILPSTIPGRTAAFAVFLAALYPMDRLMASTRSRPAWHHWAGVALGTTGYWLLLHIRVRDDVSLVLSAVCAVGVVFALAYHFLRGTASAS